MADTTKIALLGAAGAAVWWFYFRTPSATPATGAAPTPTTPAPGGAPVPPAGGGPPAPPAPPATPAPSLDQLYGQLVSAAGAAGPQYHDPDNYNSMLTQIYPAAGPLPDPNQLFGDSGWTRPNQMPIAFYWSLTAPWLKANKGLSGYGRRGLGFVGEALAGGY